MTRSELNDNKRKKTRLVDVPTKAVVVAFSIRVPTSMRHDKIAAYIRTAVMSEAGNYPPGENEYYVTINKDRIEIFMP
jgi:hypothetical protein